MNNPSPSVSPILDPRKGPHQGPGPDARAKHALDSSMCKHIDTSGPCPRLALLTHAASLLIILETVRWVQPAERTDGQMASALIGLELYYFL